ncbi:hypothetical protein CSKR_104917, partial [Clonorchis sinensis]
TQICKARVALANLRHLWHQSEGRKQSGGQPLTWKKGMKEITKRLAAAEDRVILTAPFWGRCKAWLLIDVSGVLVFDYYSDCQNECLEVGSPVLKNDAILSMMMMMMMMMTMTPLALKTLLNFICGFVHSR